jgi:EAL domain-containing protein (putative c-di-GMP-specific phosphodiesterase class I)
VPIHQGDILHFAHFEFRLGLQESDKSTETGDPDEERSTLAVAGGVDLPHNFIEGTRELEELLREGAITPVFLPIVTLPERNVAAYEVHGRGRYPGLPEDPTQLFRIAAGIGVEANLSRLIRRKALESVSDRTDLPPLFLDAHSAELDRSGLSNSLRELRALARNLELILQIHESAIAHPTSIANLRAWLYELQIGLAYDDFRTSQARLLQLAELPPDYLMFEPRFVHRIDQAPPSRRRLLTSLVSAARDLMVISVAKGVETAAEAEVCVKIGFTHAQGNLFGRPIPAEQL